MCILALSEAADQADLALATAHEMAPHADSNARA